MFLSNEDYRSRQPIRLHTPGLTLKEKYEAACDLLDQMYEVLLIARADAANGAEMGLTTDQYDKVLDQYTKLER